MDHRSAFRLSTKPGEAAVLMYLHLRRVEGEEPATRETIITDTGLSERTVDSALARLRREGKIEKITTYKAKKINYTR